MKRYIIVENKVPPATTVKNEQNRPKNACSEQENRLPCCPLLTAPMATKRVPTEVKSERQEAAIYCIWAQCNNATH